MVVDFNVSLLYRTITVPAALLGVSGDHDVTECDFHIPRYYQDEDDTSTEIDLSTFNIYIDTKNAKDVSNIYQITDITVGEEELTFKWWLDNYITASAGTVTFSLQLKQFAVDGYTIVKQINTKPQSFKVQAGFAVDSTTDPLVIDAIAKQLADFKASLQGDIETFEGEAEEQLEEKKTAAIAEMDVKETTAKANIDAEATTKLNEIKQYDSSASQSAQSASNSATTATESASSALTSASEASISANAAAASESNALSYEQTASSAASSATSSASSASESAASAENAAAQATTITSKSIVVSEEEPTDAATKLWISSLDSPLIVPEIDDTQSSSTTTYSSDKINSLLDEQNRTITSLVWENPNPMQPFAAQYIAIPNLSDYSHLLIECAASEVGQQLILGNGLCSINAGYFAEAFDRETLTFHTRSFYFYKSTSNIGVEDAYQSKISTAEVTVDNTHIIPVRVYGIKI